MNCRETLTLRSKAGSSNAAAEKNASATKANVGIVDPPIQDRIIAKKSCRIPARKPLNYESS